MKQFLRTSGILAICALLTAQTTFTPGQPATQGTPAKMIAQSGNLSCTATGDKFPATQVSVSCQWGSIVIPPFTVAAGIGEITLALTNGTGAVVMDVNAQAQITVKASSGTQPAVSGAF